MAAPDMDVIKEIPGYKVILKAVLKAQIQQLVEQLAEHTSEDSIILTASIHDGTLSHLGSDSGKSFLDDHEDVKSQFLGFCLKYHHKKKQEQEQKEREEAMRKAAAAAAVQANTFSPRHFMPTRSPRHPSPRFMGARHPLRSPNQRHQPYPITRPIRAAPMAVSTPSPLKSPNKIDGQIIKIEPEDSNDEASNQGSGAPESDINNQSSSQSPSNTPSTPSKVKSESGEKDDDARSESSNSTIPNEPPAEGLSLDSDLSNLISGNNQQQSSETTSEIDPNVSVKLEALTENEMELEITGVEPGRPAMPQDNWDPNVSMGMNYDPTGATGNQGDMMAQGYNEEEDYESEQEETEDMSPRKRFKAISDLNVEKLKSGITEKTTDSSTKWAVSLLKAWMSENDFPNEDFEGMDLSVLDVVLQQFYACLQSRKGGSYSKSALIGIRSGINRYLVAPPFSRSLCLMKDREFTGSNRVLTGLLKTLKREGKNVPKKVVPISDEDQVKLYECGIFSLDKPVTLQYKVIYEIMVQFGRRGRDKMQALTKGSFVIKTDENNRRYLALADTQAWKGTDSQGKEPRLYETEDEFCPLKSYEKYLSKLNRGCDNLFQRPNRSFKNEESTVWYEDAPLGLNKINGFMARLSEEAMLSKRYTNNCI